MPTIPAPDGRIIEYATTATATAGGRYLVFHHGQPGAAYIPEALAEAADLQGLAVVVSSRPGYGTSTRQPGRRVVAAAADTRAVLDHLGCDWFVTAGWSGGGPHALACAALLAPGCRGAATIAGVAPWFGVDDLDWTAGMGPENVAEFNGLLSGDPQVEGQIVDLCRELAGIGADRLADALGGLVSVPDRHALDSGAAGYLSEWMRRSASSGHYGYWDDGHAFIGPWGFDPAQVQVPVHVWIAGQDLMVPPSHGEWLAGRIPRAEKFRLADEGHISLMTRHIDEIVAELVGSASAG